MIMKTPAFAAALLAVTLLAAALRIPGVEHDSYWVDELFTARRMTLTFSALLRDLEDDVQAPLYFVAAWALVRVTGEVDATLRYFSAVTGTLAVPATGILAAQIGGPAAGIAAAAFLAVNRFHVHFSREARPYSLLSFLAAVSFGAAILWLRSRRTRWAVVHVVVASGLLYVHYFGSVLVASEMAAATALALLGGERLWWRRYVWIVILYLPWLALEVDDLGRTSFWPPPPGLHSLRQLATQWWTPDPVLLTVTAVFLLIGIVTLARRRWPACLFIVAWMIGPIVVAWFASRALSFSVWVPRYLIGSLPAWAVVVGIGVAALPRPLGRATALSVMMLGTLIVSSHMGDRDIGPRGHADVRAASEWISRANRSRPVEILCNRHPVALEWYLREETAWTGKTLAEVGTPLPDRFWLLEPLERLTAAEYASIRRTHRPLSSRAFGLTRATLFARASSAG